MTRSQLLQLYEIEAALISSPEALLGLPALLKAQPGCIKGPIYATLAALDVARHLVCEITGPGSLDLQHAQGCPQEIAASAQPAADASASASMRAQEAVAELASALGVQQPSQEPVFEACWGMLYSAWEAEEAFSRVKVCSCLALAQ